MKEATGDLWTFPGDIKCITTNGDIRRDGKLVMGAGVALQAAKRYPKLSALLGYLVYKSGNVPIFLCEYKICTFPTKHHWQDKSSYGLIEESAQHLVELANYHKDWKVITMTRPGCGLGGLLWDDVRKLLRPILDDRFIVLKPDISDEI